MDKKEILDEMVKIKERLANMEKMLEECEYERFKPKTTGEDYYCVDDGNDVRRVNFNVMNAYDRDRIRAYNCFKTKEEAEAEAEKILVRRMLEDIARRLNRGREIDWNTEEQSKYYICTDNEGIEYNVNFTEKAQGVVYCLDANFLDVVLKEIGKERLKAYLRGE